MIVPKSFKRDVCGLCGDFDNNKENDWTVGPACPGNDPGSVVRAVMHEWTICIQAD